jgi:hypothetical protein
MTHAEHAAERRNAWESGAVIAPPVKIDELRSSRQRAQPSGSSSSQTLSARGDFRYYVDSRGLQHFNFEQKIWRNPAVQMAVTPVMTTALETLAINLLAYTTPERTDRPRVCVKSKDLVRLARRFCAECLLTACPAGWVIPRCTIEAWLVSQRRLQGPATSTALVRQQRKRPVARDKKPNRSYTKKNCTMRRPRSPYGLSDQK